MDLAIWRDRSLIERIRLLRFVLPLLLVGVVISYQLGVARTLAENYGHLAHYSIEIAFYSLTGPVITWLTLVWVERNLTEKEHLEREVRSRTEQLASLTDASADAILSLDGEGNILSWNQGAARLFGYSASEVLGSGLMRLLPESSSIQERLLRDQVVKDFETSGLCKDGRTRTVNLTQTAIGGRNGDRSLSLLILRDVTIRKERESILEEERARIARDLHDGLAQTLYFMALKADNLRQRFGQGSEHLNEELTEIGQGARRVIREVRGTIFALRPLNWSDEGFLPALRQFIAGYAEQMSWQTETTIDPELKTIPSHLEPAVFRLVQESLNNVAKHAKAGRIMVNVCKSGNGNELVLKIEDDGGGFEPDNLSHLGLGIEQMNRRVKSLGGKFRLTSKPNGGTAVTAYLPLVEE